MAEGEEKPSSQFAVALKLPPFWPNDPRIWFAQIEAQFLTRGITQQQTKYAYIVSALQPEIAVEVRDLLLESPGDNPYDTLKEELIRRTSASTQKRLHQLLIAEELGDRKPTQLLRRMRQLLGDHKLEESILKQLFLQRLPANVQLILAPTNEAVSIDQLAVIADRVLEVTPQPEMQIAAATSLQLTESAHSETSELRKMIETLTEKVNALSSKLRSRSRSRSNNRGNRRRDGETRRPRSPTPNDHQGDDCWYHWRYGDKAHKCLPPCTYGKTKQGNENASN